MKALYKWIILIALLFAALISYSYGFSQGIVLFILLGVTFELAFWVGTFSKKTRTNKP